LGSGFNHDVGRLEVAVDETLGVEVLETRQHSPRHCFHEPLGNRVLLRLDEGVEVVLPFFHHNAPLELVLRYDFVAVDEVGVRGQFGEDIQFSFDAIRDVHLFDGDSAAFEGTVEYLSVVDCAECAAGEFVEDFVLLHGGFLDVFRVQILN
jgi:hypothetical protein